MSQATETHRSGLYYVIPSSVFEDCRLEHSEVVFYALISGLATNEGYCYASDLYFSSRMKVSERTIRDWLQRLEKFGHLKRETTKKGMYWDRKIFVFSCISKSSYDRHSSAGSIGTSAGSIGTPVPDRQEPQCRIVSKEELESKEYIPPTPKKGRNPAKAGSRPSELLCIGSFVKLKKEDISKLQELYGTKEALEEQIAIMNDYIAMHGTKYKDYAAALRNWFRRKESNPSPTSGISSSSSNQKLAEKVEQKFHHPDIRVGHDYIEFHISSVVPADHIKFSEHGFRERVLKRLKDWKMDVTDL